HGLDFEAALLGHDDLSCCAGVTTPPSVCTASCCTVPSIGARRSCSSILRSALTASSVSSATFCSASARSVRSLCSYSARVWLARAARCRAALGAAGRIGGGNRPGRICVAHSRGRERPASRFASADFMEACLQPVQRRVAAGFVHELLMVAVFDDATALDGDDAIGVANGRQPMGDDYHGPPLRNLLHVLVNDPLALIVERARRLVEDEDARIADSARAIAMRWRWPPDRLVPRSPTTVS